jgi:hypothetical protein
MFCKGYILFVRFWLYCIVPVFKYIETQDSVSNYKTHLER